MHLEVIPVILLSQSTTVISALLRQLILRHRDNHTFLAILAIAVLVTGGFLLSVSVALPDGDHTYKAIQNFSHFLLFAFLGWAVLLLAHRLIGLQYWKSVAITAVGLFALGLAIEVFQINLASRDASLADLALDTAGILVGVLLFSMPSFLRLKNKVWAVVAFIVMAVTVAVSMKNVAPLIGFDLTRPPIPVVRSFNERFSAAKIEGYGGAHFSRELSKQQECCVLRMVFEPAQYSGVIFHERSARWSDYERLSIKIYSYLPDTRQIILRINDGLHNNLYEDRYNGSFEITPGLNELDVPLSLIVMMGNNDSAGRKMNIDDVTMIQLFTVEIESSFELDLLSVKLN